MMLIPNALLYDDESQSVLFSLLKEYGFEWKTPMDVYLDDDMYPEGISSCPACGYDEGYTFNMTQYINDVSWTLHNCHCCEKVSYFRDTRYSLTPMDISVKDIATEQIKYEIGLYEAWLEDMCERDDESDGKYLSEPSEALDNYNRIFDRLGWLKLELESRK